MADGTAASLVGVVLVDDQAMIRDGLARILSPADGFEVLAECADGDEVVAAVTTHRPDVVVMDLRMRSPVTSSTGGSCR